VQPNVVPAELTVGFDLRVTPSYTIEEMEAVLEEWALECDVKLEWVNVCIAGCHKSITIFRIWVYPCMGLSLYRYIHI